MKIKAGDWVMMKDGKRIRVEVVERDGTFMGTVIGQDEVDFYRISDVEEIAWD